MTKIDFTSAGRDEIKVVYDAIAREIQDDRFFTTKELDVLPKILSPYEQVLSFSSGYMDANTWLIVLTDQRILLVDKGMIFGLTQTSIELENIVSIEGATGLFFGDIKVFTAAGPKEIRNVWKRTVNPFVNKVRQAQAAKRSGVEMLSPGRDRETQQSSEVRQASSEGSASETTTAQGVDRARGGTSHVAQTSPALDGNPDRMAEIARLERLRNAGSISEEEYRAQMVRFS